MTGAKPLPAHGTLSRRKYHKCKCEPCMEAGRAYARNRHRKLGYGTWQPLVDAQPARDHVQRLRAAGLGWQRVAEAAGIPIATMERLLYGAPADGRAPAKRIRPDTEAKILAVRPSAALLPPGACVPAVGTVRRLQALHAVGWPGVWIAERIGTYRRYVSDLLLRRHRSVQLATAERVREVYEELIALDPVEHGVGAQDALRARNTAARNGWLPPSAWAEDIDDPDADPMAADRPGVPDVPKGELQARARLLHEVQGLSLKATAAQVGVADRTVLRWKQAGWGEAA